MKDSDLYCKIVIEKLEKDCNNLLKNKSQDTDKKYDECQDILLEKYKELAKILDKEG